MSILYQSSVISPQRLNIYFDLGHLQLQSK